MPPEAWEWTETSFVQRFVVFVEFLFERFDWFLFLELRLEELLRPLLIPLFAKIGWHDDKNPALPLGPLLGKDEARLNSPAQAHFIRDQSALGEW